MEKEKDARQREYDEEKTQLLDDFEEYRKENNQGMLLVCKAETEDALRKLEEYQNSYQKVIMELDE